MKRRYIFLSLLILLTVIITPVSYAQQAERFNNAITDFETKLNAYEAKVNVETSRNILETLHSEANSAWIWLVDLMAYLGMIGMEIPHTTEISISSMHDRLKESRAVQTKRISSGEVKYEDT